MGTLKRDCPHCDTKSMTFQAFSSILMEGKGTYLTAFKCNGCHSGYMVEFGAKRNKTPQSYNGDFEAVTSEFTILKEYPETISNNIPEYLPENINIFYSQAVSAFKAGNYDSSAMMSRKVLEVSVKKIHPEGTGTLYRRIEGLASEGLITEDLKEWAHIIREDGNESAHEETPVDFNFADEILSFTGLFLLYVFTMPAMIKEKKSKEE